MYRQLIVALCIVLMTDCLQAQSQSALGTKYLFSLDDVIQLAKEQSTDAIMARHNFRANYFSFRSYKAQFLPKIALNLQPTSYNHSIETLRNAQDGKSYETNVNNLTSTAGLSLSQNIGLTGGSVSLGSDFRRVQNFYDNAPNTEAYTTKPITFSVNQPLNGYNRLKWEKKIEPLRFEQSKQNYIAQMESIANAAVDYFFRLASAQVNLIMAINNYENSKKLYEISMGRYQIGTIAEDALLQMELKYMQAESTLNEAKMSIEYWQSQLRSFLGFKDNVEIELSINPEIPKLKIPYDKALTYALSLSPDMIAYNLSVLSAQQTVALRKSEKGINMSIGGSFGLNKTASAFKEAYSPRYIDQEGVSIGISVPILDWNQQKDRYRNAQSLLEVAQTQKEQNETKFRQNVYLQVAYFNMQEDQLRIKAKADTIAQKGYEVSYQRYLIGKVSVTDLNIADNAKDDAKKSYIDQLKAFWTYYYTVRQLTLFDFQNNKPLDADFENITGE